jgi:FdhD protein
MRPKQKIFDKTGGLHAAGLFDPQGKLIVVREDVGRHIAVDKVIGYALMNDLLPLDGYSLAISGRGGFEIIQKAIAARILPWLRYLRQLLAVETAREFGCGFTGDSATKYCQRRKPLANNRCACHAVAVVTCEFTSPGLCLR